ncbi:hypothetical protein BDN71DRAFT_1454925 [Pleurotus eryngii]|uniref:Uncharacterized protein n=1 Tax=Pleurotus eryngii TaxID=5323 RepID=A0A9P5ZMD6_PLEER|nr:hypothetical protein BDN71DRAFT_1454925 [Pleurotus eryngii]
MADGISAATTAPSPLPSISQALTPHIQRRSRLQAPRQAPDDVHYLSEPWQEVINLIASVRNA